MATDRIGTRIEKLIAQGEWAKAQDVIEKQLVKKPDSHWLLSRLATVRYEQRDYAGALANAMRALEIVPDCPLALWEQAGALDMLGDTKAAVTIYKELFRRGVQQLKTPDQDANECWEGKEWTTGLVVDCLFRIAGCLADAGRPEKAEKFYREFLELWMVGARGIYSGEEALEKLNALRSQVEADVSRAVLKKATTVKRDLMSVGN